MRDITNSTDELLSLKRASETLGVSIETLIEWNDNNILKPTITPTGDVCYSKGQIDKFLSVLTILRQKTNPPDTVPNIQNATSYTQNDSLRPAEVSVNQDIAVQQVQKTPSTDITTSSPYHNQKKSKSSKRFWYVGITTSLVGVLGISMLVFSTQSKQIPTPKSSDVESVQSAKTTLQLPDSVKTPGNNDTNTQALTPPENDLTPNLLTFSEESASVSGNVKKSISNFPSHEPNGEQVAQVDTDSEEFNLNPSTVGNFASRSNTQSDQKNTQAIFDENGNIQGEVDDTNNLASVIGTSIISNTQPVKRTANFGIILVSVTLGLMWLFYLLNKQPAYSFATSGTTQAIPNSPSIKTHVQRVLEVKQKTDGSVVLVLDNQEYKISKPELNSETDRLIERLMELTTGDIQKIEYDILKDQNIKLNAPLSKLVTRLGFVGTKRDLFFPRTSKNKVLFRRYITKHDLDTIGITQNQLANRLLN